MEVFRICFAPFAKLIPSGREARWNSGDVNIIYTSSSRALACLENVVHRNRTDLTDDFRTLVIEIPDNLPSVELKDTDLPAGWDKFDEESLKKCRKVGDKWVAENSSLTLIVPSAIVIGDKNVLINPNHQDFAKVRILKTELFLFDPRIKS